jgi:hypothetical protein
VVMLPTTDDTYEMSCNYSYETERPLPAAAATVTSAARNVRVASVHSEPRLTGGKRVINRSSLLCLYNSFRKYRQWWVASPHDSCSLATRTLRAAEVTVAAAAGSGRSVS